MNFFRCGNRALGNLKWRYIGAFLLVLLSTAGKIYLPMTFLAIYDEAILARNYEALCYYSLRVVWVFVFMLITNLCGCALLFNVREKMIVRLRQNLHNAILKSPFLNLRKMETGDLINRVVLESDSIGLFYTGQVPNFLLNLFMLLGTVVFMGSIDFGCTALCLLLLFGVYFATKYYSPKIMSVSKEELELRAGLTSLAEQIVQNIPLLKYVKGYGYAASSFGTRIDAMKRNKYKLTKWQQWFTRASDFMIFLPMILVDVIWGLKVITGAITFGSYAILLSYTGKLLEPASSIFSYIGEFQGRKAMVQRHEEVLKLCPRGEEQGIGKLKTAKQFESIAFKRVNFNYGEKRVLEQLSFKIKAGERVQLKGGNGSGKSTIINLMAGLLEPTEGEILFNGESLEQIDIGKLMAVVPQGSYFFEDTVEDNILLGREDSKGELKPLVEELNLQELLEGEKVNFKTQLTSRGDNVSGGQAQKINILRSLLTNAPLVIFDEVDTFLDPKTKDSIYKYVQSHQEKTFIFISHEELTKIKMDQVINL